MPRTFSPSELEFIKEVAQERVKFHRIFMEQSAVFRTDEAEYYKAMARFKEAGHAKHWVPQSSPEKIEECLRKCEELCKPEPHNFNE
jgi:hypothetical protein